MQTAYSLGLSTGLKFAQEGRTEPSVPSHMSQTNNDFRRGFGYAVRTYNRERARSRLDRVRH